MFYRDLEKRRQKIRKYIRENPNTTYRDLRRIGINIYKAYKGGMSEAFRDAEIIFPRTFKIKTREEKKRILIDYVRKHPFVGGHTVRKDTKINFQTLFKTTEKLFKAAGVKYPRKIDKRTREEKKNEIINLIKNNPILSVDGIMNIAQISFYKFFRNFDEAYKEANIDNISGHDKRKLRKREKVIKFIKNNPLATQREINLACNTHVQLLFKEGIFDAYKEAGIKYPYERLFLYGSATKEIKRRSKEFEDNIAVKLSGYGKVNRLVKTKRGFADIIFERNGKKIIVEIKDYLAKEISISQIKQLNKYLEDCDCNMGILICHERPMRDKFLIGKNRIFVLEEVEINKIPEMMDEGAW